jgi:SAM-dependent methyltransferase
VKIRRPSPQAPQFRYYGYERLEDVDYSLPLRIVRAIKPELVKVKHNDKWWLEDYSLPKDEKAKWMDRLALTTDSVFNKHLRVIREQAWQEVQEFSIARWWFLRNRLQMNPYHSQIIEAAREGASVADLACGLGQDLRYLRDTGATGKMWAIDINPKIWKLGTQLFNDAPGPAEFIEADIVSRGYENPCGLHVLHDKIDIFLLNDYLSFLGREVVRYSLATIAYASKPGSKILGWAFGSDRLDHMGLHSTEIWGDGMRGVIHHPDAFREQTWKTLENETTTKWDLHLQLMEPEEFGFGTDELKLIWGSYPLKVLCFFATRLQ